MNLHDYILAQGPQGNNRPNSTSFYLGGKEVIPEIFQQIVERCSDHTRYLLELAIRDLCGFIGNLPSQTQQYYYDSEEEFDDGYDTIDEVYNDDHLDYDGEPDDDNFEMPEY